VTDDTGVLGREIPEEGKLGDRNLVVDLELLVENVLKVVRKELSQPQQQRNDPTLEMPKRQYAPHLPNARLNKIVPSLILSLLQDPLPQLRVPLKCLANDFDGLEEVVRVVEVNDFDQDVHPLLAVNSKQLEEFLLHLVN
jgi:hypothetical protein